MAQTKPYNERIIPVRISYLDADCVDITTEYIGEEQLGYVHLHPDGTYTLNHTVGTPKADATELTVAYLQAEAGINNSVLIPVNFCSLN